MPLTNYGEMIHFHGRQLCLICLCPPLERDELYKKELPEREQSLSLQSIDPFSEEEKKRGLYKERIGSLLSPSEKGSTLKGENLLQDGENSFLIE